jgi:hypothetical protein
MSAGWLTEKRLFTDRVKQLILSTSVTLSLLFLTEVAVCLNEPLLVQTLASLRSACSDQNDTRRFGEGKVGDLFCSTKASAKI